MFSYGNLGVAEGDAVRGTERLVSYEHPEADVLKVAHHGSTTSSESEDPGRCSSALRSDLGWSSQSVSAPATVGIRTLAAGGRDHVSH
jgi:hypothetical protein